MLSTLCSSGVSSCGGYWVQRTAQAVPPEAQPALEREQQGSVTALRTGVSTVCHQATSWQERRTMSPSIDAHQLSTLLRSSSELDIGDVTATVATPPPWWPGAHALPESTYEPGRSQLSVKVPQAPEERFPAVVAAADALLAVATAAA